MAGLLNVVLSGTTFVGVASLVPNNAERVYSSKLVKVVGRMTLAYRSAQVIAPIHSCYLTESFADLRARLS